MFMPRLSRFISSINLFSGRRGKRRRDGAGRSASVGRRCHFQAFEPRLPLTFHLWQMDQVFSSADGKVQFIELHDPANGESHLTGHFISSNENKFTFPTDLPTDATANHHFLIGTTDYAKQPGAVTPDYIVPDNFFSTSGDTLDYADVDSFTFMAAQLPTDGTNAMFRNVTTLALSIGPNSETNLAGQTGSVNLASHVNLPPTIDPVSDVSLAVNAGPQTINLSGITGGQGENESVTVTAQSSNTALIPNLTVNYTSPNTTGSLSFTPASNATGTAIITLTLKDNGGTANGGQDTTTVSFNVTVAFSTAQFQQFITKVYHDLLGRDPDTDGLNFWTNQLASGVPRSQIATTLTHTPEYFSTIIKPAYLKYLGRPADDTGLSFWTTQMQDGLTDEHLEAAFIGSAEFFQHAGGTDKLWVDAMYNDLLGRQPDPAGEAFWVQQLAMGAQRADVAFGFAASVEREQQRVTLDYQHFLGRTPDQQGLDFWVTQFQMGFTNEDLIAGFIASDEYFDAAIAA
jgi:hypothetical protein